MKYLKIGVGVLAVAVAGLLGAAAMQPDVTHVERSLTMAATPADVFPYVNNFEKWKLWSPWDKIDPNQKVTFSGPKEGKGARYEWQGNKDVGHGTMEIIDSVPNQKVVETLHFIEPFESTAKVTLSLTPEGAGTKVLWSYDAEASLMEKTFGLFMDMDQMLGTDFDHGLKNMQPLAEADAKARIEAEAAAAAAAAAAVAATDPNAPAAPAAGTTGAP